MQDIMNKKGISNDAAQRSIVRMLSEAQQCENGGSQFPSRNPSTMRKNGTESHCNQSPNMTVTDYMASPDPRQSKNGEAAPGLISKAVSTFSPSPLSMTATFMSNPYDTLSKFHDIHLQERAERNGTLKLSPSTKNQGTGITPPPILNASKLRKEDSKLDTNNDIDPR